MTRDRVQNALRRAHTDALHNTTIDVYRASETYTAGEGYDVTYPSSADATYDARLDSPSDDAQRERSGTTSEIDAEVRVRDDTGESWTDFGESGDATTRVEDTQTGIRYEVQTVIDAHGGLVTLGVVEV